MRIPFSLGDARAGHPASDDVSSVTASVTLSERSLIVLALVRLFVGLLWFQQIFWKMPPDFAGLHRYVVEEGEHTFLPGYAFIIQHLFLPHFLLLGACIWGAELVVGWSLLFGACSRFGALLSTVLAVQLYVGLAYAPGEWYWTYGMLVLLGLALAAVPAGRRLGVDQWLAPHLAKRAQAHRWSRVLSWLA